ncbi:DUF1700 domain-containing protein [Jiangella mangrovi]|uniref:DUF1700 domain-containing protein n=1 Tax=Jiangella mangrovi TaxID=1524084 RepID=A0A7W9GR01_9ACTN|nr:hypothetical protein [Jiangella mangrovi]MBB5788244.1 hypothetical protein [Jiangella mangrovi]
MEEPMLTATQHLRIDRYLGELDGALGALPETERADVVAGVREHIQAALADRGEVTDADVDEVLRALGDPLTIAAEATGDDGVSGGPAVAAPGSGPRQLPLTSRDRTPGLVVALLGAAPVVLTLFAMLGGFFLLPVALIGGWTLLWLSPLWGVGEKLAGTFLLPSFGLVLFSFTFLVTGGGSEVCVSDSPSDGPESAPVCTSNNDAILTPLAAWIILGVLAIAAVVTAVVLVRHGRRRSAELAQSFSTGA